MSAIVGSGAVVTAGVGDSPLSWTLRHRPGFGLGSGSMCFLSSEAAADALASRHRNAAPIPIVLSSRRMLLDPYGKERLINGRSLRRPYT